MQLTVEQHVAASDARVLIVAPSGEVDLASAAVLREGLERAESEPAVGLVIDLRRVGFIDSTGIGELVGSHRRCRDQGRPLAFIVPEGTISKILRVTGMDAVFELFGDEPSAVAALTSEDTISGGAADSAAVTADD